MVYQGPIKPGTSEKEFRDSGKSIPLFQGPIKPGTSEEVFRRTGRSSGGSSSSSSGGVAGPTRADLEREQARQQEIQRQQEQTRQQEAQKQQQFKQFQQQTALQKQQQDDGRLLTLEKAEPRTFLQKLRSDARVSRQRGKPDVRKELFGAGAGFVTSIGRQAQFVKEAITSPIKTAKGTKESIFEAGRRIKTGEGFPELTRLINEEPGFATGFIGGEVVGAKALGKGISKAGKVSEGLRTRISPKFRPITKIETEFGTEQLISNLDIGGKKTIKIIPAGVERKLPTLRPSVRGGFGFTKAEQKVFTKQRGPLVSGQADFPEELFGKPLEKEFFATPSIEETGFVRVSRLGAEQPQASLSDVLFGEVTTKKAKPQIFAFADEQIGRKGGFKPQLVGTELETILPPGRVITKGKKVGVTLVDGKRVPIFRTEVAGTKLTSADDIFQKELLGGIQKTKVKVQPTESIFQRELRSSLDVSTTPRVSSKRITTTAFTKFGRGTTRTTPTSMTTKSIDLESSIFSSKPITTKTSGGTSRSLSQIIGLSPKTKGSFSLSSSTPTTSRRVPTIPKKSRLLGFTKQRAKTKKEKIKAILDEPLIFTPDFTSRVTNIKQKISMKNLEKQIRSESGLGLRKIPVFTKSKSEKKRSHIFLD